MNKGTAQMSEAARKAQREYKKKWRADHPESVRKSNIKYWERYAERHGESISRKRDERHGEGQE